MDLNLTGRTTLVTGASQGIGRAVALGLAAEGARLFVTARNRALLGSLAEEIEAAGGHRPQLLVQDFSDEHAAQRIAETALGALGQVDILVNNAGGSRPVEPDASDDVWTEGMTLNFDRHRQLTQLLLPGFIARRSGAIINISGTLEPRTVNTAIVAKAALVVWSKGLSEALGPLGITVNCVKPGLIDTAQIRRLLPGKEAQAIADRDIALRHLGEPQDVADAVTFLASSRARYITGAILNVDGGLRRYSF